MINKPHFFMHYSPVKKIAGYGVSVPVSKDFVEFAKTVKDIDKDYFERYGLECIRASGWPDFTRQDICHAPSICGWWEDTGLLHYINVPGNAAGIVLVESMPREWRYSPNNMDDITQASAVIGIMSQYLMQIMLRIPDSEHPLNL
ncbi:MAG: hypothetical protein ABIB79_02355 [archaeon]